MRWRIFGVERVCAARQKKEKDNAEAQRTPRHAENLVAYPIVTMKVLLREEGISTAGS
jgi:hypothetical protein